MGTLHSPSNRDPSLPSGVSLEKGDRSYLNLKYTLSKLVENDLKSNKITRVCIVD